MNIDFSKNKPNFLHLRYVFTTVSSTDPNTTYITIITDFNKFHDEDICSCPGFNYRKVCRHMNEARAFMTAASTDTQTHSAEVNIHNGRT